MFETVINNILANLLQYVFSAIALIVIVFVAKHWKALGAWIKAKKAAAEADANEKLQALLWAKALEAYVYAETVFAELDGTGKLNEALEYLSGKLKLLGISFSAEELRAAIEKAWYEYEGQYKTETTA